MLFVDGYMLSGSGFLLSTVRRAPAQAWVDASNPDTGRHARLTSISVSSLNEKQAARSFSTAGLGRINARFNPSSDDSARGYPATILA